MDAEDEADEVEEDAPFRVFVSGCCVSVEDEVEGEEEEEEEVADEAEAVEVVAVVLVLCGKESSSVAPAPAPAPAPMPAAAVEADASSLPLRVDTRAFFSDAIRCVEESKQIRTLRVSFMITFVLWRLLPPPTSF